MISTTTTLTVEPSTAVYGIGDPFHASVTAAITPDSVSGDMLGAVSFFNGSQLITEIPVSFSTTIGYAGFFYDTAPVGTLSISCQYSGDSTYAPSASSAASLLITRGYATRFSLTATPSSFSFGQSVLLTAQANGAYVTDAYLATPTGTMEFDSGIGVLGTVGLDQFVPPNYSQAFLIPSPPLPVGTLLLSANYSGDSNYFSGGADTTVTCTKADTNTYLYPSPNPSAQCQEVNFTAAVESVNPYGGPPTGTVTFEVNSSPVLNAALVDGVAAYTTSGLSPGYYSIGALYGGDSNFNPSSAYVTQTVDNPVNWVLTAYAAAPDPQQGCKTCVAGSGVDPQAGSVQVTAFAVDANQSTQCSCSCGCKDNNCNTGMTPIVFVYSARTLNVKPIINASLASDFCSSVPSSITAQLTWNGVPQGTMTLATTGHSPGDVYAVQLQVGSAVMTSGYYPWTVQVQATVGTMVYSPSATGTMVLLVNTNSPFGAGVGIANKSVKPGGSVALVDNASGGSRIFSGTPGSLPFVFTSPANDQGTLQQNNDSSFTYTSKDQIVTNFDTSGRQVSQVDQHGLTQTLTYSGSLLSTIAQPDGGVATLSYNGSNQLTSVQQPGGRMLTMTYDGSNNLIGVVDAAGGVSTFSYDGSNRLINQQVGPINTTYTYSATNGSLSQINRGLGSVTTIVAAATQGLGASTAINVSQAVGAVTDPLGNVTSYTLDSLGRLTQLQTADGTLQTWTLDAAGNPTVYTDQLGRVTTSTYDGSEDLIQVQYPDGTITSYQYESTYHQVIQIQDALNHFTTMTYNESTSDQLTQQDALGNVTSFTWSNGLKQSTTDALGRVTTLSWNAANRQQTAEQDPLGNITSYGYDAAGNQISVQDALGRFTTSSYDGNRRLLTVTNALGGVATNIYDMAGNLTVSIDELGRPTSYAYDQRGLQVSVTQSISLPAAVQPVGLPRMLPTPLGYFIGAPTRTTTMVYDAATNLLYTLDPLRDVTSYAYDALNRPIAQIDAFGTSLQRATTTMYDLAGNVISSIDARATVTSYAYDVRNRQIQRIDAYGTSLQRTTSVSYDAVGNQFNVTDPLGVVTSYGYDADNRQILRVDAFDIAGLQRMSTTAYDAVGNTLFTINPVNAMTSYGYDGDNRQTLVIEAYDSDVQRTTTTAYDAVGNVFNVTDPLNVVTSFAYDALNRRIIEVDAYGTGVARTLTMAYDAVSNVLSQTNGLGVTTSFAYDALNRRINEVDAYGAGLQRTLTMVYDADDNLTASIDPLGFKTAYNYDRLNRRIAVVNPDGGIATTGYDPVDNVVNTIDQLGHNSTYAYDVLNRRTQTTDALNGIVTLAYDANNNLLSLTDPVSNETQWQYDALNRKIQEVDPLSNVSTMAYDAMNRLTSVTDKNGQLINLSYDLLNRETGENWYNTSDSLADVLTFTYDANNNLLTAANHAAANTMSYDQLNRLSTMKDSFGTLQTFSYDAADNRTALQDSFGGAITRTYDALNRVTTMQFSGQSQTLREDFGYTVRDQVAKQTRYSNLAGTTTVGYSTMGYDSVGRMTNLQHLNGSGSNIANFTNTYDLASRITAEILNGGAPTTYQYDITNQVTNDSAVTYSYDANGNRTMPGYSKGPANELLSDPNWNYYYDRNGNQVQKVNPTTGEIFSFGYDNRNRLVSVQDTTTMGLQMQATYIYDALNQRIEKDVAIGGTTTVTRFSYDDSRQIFVDINSSNALQMRYLRTMKVLELLASVTSGGIAAWLLQDRLGSVRVVVDGSGATSDIFLYDAFGNTLSESSPGNGGFYLWAGYRYDAETGLYRPDSTVIRYYDPVTGRWKIVDSIGFLGGDPNLFRNVWNSPTNAIDPSGLVTTVVGFAALIGAQLEYDFCTGDLNGEVWAFLGLGIEVKSWLGDYWAGALGTISLANRKLGNLGKLLPIQCGECKTECEQKRCAVGIGGFWERGKKLLKLPGGVEIGLLIEGGECDLTVEGVLLIDLIHSPLLNFIPPLRAAIALAERAKRLTGWNFEIGGGAIFSISGHACKAKNGGWTFDKLIAAGGLYVAVEKDKDLFAKHGGPAAVKQPNLPPAKLP